MRGLTLIGWALVAVVGGGLFMLSYEVQDRRAELRDVRAAIALDRERLHVLEAEWSYLNQPRRLRELAQDRLGLAPVTPVQMMSWEEFERRRAN